MEDSRVGRASKEGRASMAGSWHDKGRARVGARRATAKEVRARAEAGRRQAGQARRGQRRAGHAWQGERQAWQATKENKENI